MVVLNRSGHDLAGAGTEFIREHNQRAAPRYTGINVVVLLHLLVGILDLHDGPCVDKKSCQRDRFGQGSAAVIPQIEHNAVDPLFTKLIQQAFAVAGAALVLGLALACAGHIHVKTW